MIKYVLDSSAVLALLFLENGSERVRPILAESAISTVNITEVLTKLVQDNINLDQASENFFDLSLEIIAFTIPQAVKAAALRPLTRHLGLSLGDRACLALAIQENAIAVTADRPWSKLDLCPIEVIR